MKRIKPMFIVLTGFTLLVLGVTVGEGNGDYLGDISVSHVRALAACHSCPEVCKTSSGSDVSCSGASCSGTGNWACDDTGGFGSTCGTFKLTAQGPYEECVTGGPLQGACGSTSPEHICYEKSQCECNTWAYNECDCGPYTYYLHANILDGC